MNSLLLRRAIATAELVYGSSPCRWSCWKNLPFIGLQPNQHSCLYSLSTTTTTTICNSNRDGHNESKAPVARARTWKRLEGLASAKTIVKPTTMDKEKEINVKSWPKPGKIPWQPKVANSVNLIGHVQIPVQFRTSIDGKVWAATVLYTSNESGPDSPSFWIPIIFEGDLAHTAVCHLKVQDLVHISGHLSADPPPYTLTDGQASAQVMARSLSYVHVSPRPKKPIIVHDLKREIKESTEIPKADNSENQLNKKPFLEAQILRKGEIRANSFKEEEDLVKPCRINGPTEIQDKLGSSTSNNTLLIQENKLESSTSNNTLLIQENKLGGKAKFKVDADRRWKEFLNNLEDWKDNREKKLSGSLKPNYPDFKHKESGLGLWLNDAPKWVMSKLSGQPPSLDRETKFTEIPKTDNSESQLNKKPFLEGEILANSFKEEHLVKPCRINGSTEIQDKLGTSTSKNTLLIQKNKLDNGGKAKFKVDADSRWKEFLNNLEDWQDNREKKLSGSLKSKYPDFNHKESGLGLWLDDAPKWVVSKLGGQPPSLDRETKFTEFEKKSDSWKNLVEKPDKWWDNRTNKRNVKAPDFKHRETGEGLWLNHCPVFLKDRLPPLKA